LVIGPIIATTSRIWNRPCFDFLIGFSGLAGMPPVGRRHEAGALLVAGQDELDPGGARQAVEKVEILLAGHSEDIFDPFFLQALDEQVGRLGHSDFPLGGAMVYPCLGSLSPRPCKPIYSLESRSRFGS
jgi:hypothetical protein